MVYKQIQDVDQINFDDFLAFTINNSALSGIDNDDYSNWQMFDQFVNNTPFNVYNLYYQNKFASQFNLYGLFNLLTLSYSNDDLNYYRVYYWVPPIYNDFQSQKKITLSGVDTPLNRKQLNEYAVKNPTISYYDPSKQQNVIQYSPLFKLLCNVSNPIYKGAFRDVINKTYSIIMENEKDFLNCFVNFETKQQQNNMCSSGCWSEGDGF